MTTDWTLYATFSEHEFKCSCGCGKANMSPQFMRRLQTLRDVLGFPLTVTSGFRCENHPDEKDKAVLGSHPRGCAADLAVSRGQAFELVKVAIRLGFTGIGVKQKGGSRFVHVDDLDNDEDHIRPTIWSY